MDDNGNLYFAMRSRDVNDMEALGLAVDMVASFQDDMRSGKERA